MTGVNYLNKSSVGSATCKGYALNMARLFTLRGYPSPVDFYDPRCWTRIIVHNLRRKEVIAKQRKPLDASVHVKIINFAAKSNKDSLEEVVSNVIAAGKSWAGELVYNLKLVKTKLNTIGTHIGEEL